MTSPKPNLARAWRRTFWHVYDNLGLVIGANILWLLLAITILLKPAASMGIFYIAYQIVHDRPVKIKDFFRGLYRYLLKTILIMFILCIVWLILLFNIKFYLQHLIILAGIGFWLFIFSLMGLVYIYPLLCKDYGIWKTIKFSYLLVFDNLWITLILFFYLLLLALLEILIPILGMGILTIFIQNAFLEIEKRYNPQLEIVEPRRRLREILRPWELGN